jgi:rhodanese-related sulfurtransferase
MERSAEPTDLRHHWDGRYTRIGASKVSWYEPVPTMSLELLDALGADRRTSLIDVGGGSSSLVDALVERDWRDLTVLDVSPVAVGIAEGRLGPSPVSWVVADLLRWWPPRHYDIWHDRAVFHFLTAEYDRELYRCRLAAAVPPGGHAIIATFAPDGPEQCSALPAQRYDAASLAAAAAPGFELLQERRQVHRTPAGGEQPFTWVLLRAPDREGADLDAYLGQARDQIDQVPPARLAGEQADGAFIVDMRPVEQRDRDGAMPGAVVVDRNVLEWRTVWTSPHRLPEVTSPDLRIVLVCNQGYASSVAAATLRRLGMRRATDLAGGFQAWLAYRAGSTAAD